MPSLNKVMLIGNLTRDPEVRYTPKGTAVVDLGMAMNRKYRLESGEEREEVTFVDVAFFGKQAETLAKWMKKGRPIYIEGRLRLDSWEDKNTGAKQYKLRVQGEEFQFLGGRDDAPGGGGYPDSGGASSGGGSGGGGSGGGGYPPQAQRTNYGPRNDQASGGGGYPPQQQQRPAPQQSQAPQAAEPSAPDYAEMDGDDIPF